MYAPVHVELAPFRCEAVQRSGGRTCCRNGGGKRHPGHDGRVERVQASTKNDWEWVWEEQGESKIWWLWMGCSPRIFIFFTSRICLVETSQQCHVQWLVWVAHQPLNCKLFVKFRKWTLWIQQITIEYTRPEFCWRKIFCEIHHMPCNIHRTWMCLFLCGKQNQGCYGYIFDFRCG